MNGPQSVKIGGLLRKSDYLLEHVEAGAAHLVSDFATPLQHFRNGLFVHALARLPDGVHDGEVGLERVQRLHGGLRRVSRGQIKRAFAAYGIVALRHDGEAVV